MSERVFVGIGREREAKYGPIIKLSFSEADVRRMQEHLHNGWVNVDVMRRKTPDGDNTHFAQLDLWKPTRSEQVDLGDGGSESIPF